MKKKYDMANTERARERAIRFMIRKDDFDPSGGSIKKLLYVYPAGMEMPTTI